MSRGGDDCFALPPGVDWTPVDAALRHLQDRLAPLALASESVGLGAAGGRVLALDAVARRAHPATDNAAVDGYAFAHPGVADPLDLALAPGRSAAGAPFQGTVASGGAVRILTGAAMPQGADTVVLQEDVVLEGDRVRFTPPKKPGANRRRAGENIALGATVLSAGAALTPPALAQLASAGLDRVSVRPRLRVGVLSTGDELTDPGAGHDPAQVIDANRPMLLDWLRRAGFEPVDLGVARDDAGALQAAFERAAASADALLTSGGASGGDEDHVSRTLADTGGAFHLWRVAMKPGRPMVFGRWRELPVFGLPGNPVAALVCALIFARPSLRRLAGMGWSEPAWLTAPSGFDYPKKPGRREYLRVRVGADGRLEKYRSEGSGLIEGLLWSDGLADIPHDDGPFSAGAPLRFAPWSAFDA